MCGICGMTWNDAALVQRMAERLAHRGPDQEGEYCAEGISLGHRRLSIIDLSEKGRQPICNEDRTVWLVANGEIYNFQELRRELEQQGHRFTSQSDSEVIVHAYEEYGPEAVDRLRGMFAFALYDSTKRRLLLVRDRMGIKPLYYAECRVDGEPALIFASEIKAMLEYRGLERRVNAQALYDYLGFEFVPAPQTMFAGIRKLPAGHLALFEHGQLAIRQYWDLSFAPGKHPSFQESVERLREQLDFAVKSHLVADVPLGVFLSGGLDSSCIVALMRRHIGGPLKTFTIGYKDATFSELDYAAIVAREFGTEHQVLYLDSLNADYVEQTLYHLDEPMTDLSTVPLYLLCRQAREQVTVCLSGEGADESFAGYDRFKASRLNRCFSLLPAALRHRLVGPLVERLPDQPQKKGAINMLKRFVEGALLPEDGGHLRWQYFLNKSLERRLFQDSFRTAINGDPFWQVREYARKAGAADAVNREIYLDLRFMMTDSVLMKVDRMSMASSLEIRVPLLDHVLVSFLASLPGDWKLHRMTTKYIFRAALEGLLPDKIVHRGKQGYSLPVKHLLRGQLRDYMIERLHSSAILREYMHMDAIDTLIEEHTAMRQNHNHTLWALLNVAIWHDRFFN